MISLRKLAAGSLAAVLAFSMAACGSDSTDSSADSTSGKVVKVDEKSAKATSLADFGTMDDLVAAAEKEGQLNVIALPHNWSNYGEVINGFKKKYPNIKINELNPNASSKEEVDAAKTNKGTDAAPDVFDLGHAEAGTGTGRLHEQRVLQSGLLNRDKHLVRFGGKFGSGIIITHIQRDAGSHGNTSRSQQYLRIMLVHAGGGSEHAATNVRHVHHFEQALNRAILTVRTMQYRKHGVHVTKRSQRAVIFTSEETILAKRHIQHHIFGGIRLLHHR